MIYVKYTNKRDHGVGIGIWEMSDDLNKERCVYTNGEEHYPDEWINFVNDNRELSLVKEWKSIYDVTVLTRDEFFLEMI